MLSERTKETENSIEIITEELKTKWKLNDLCSEVFFMTFYFKTDKPKNERYAAAARLARENGFYEQFEACIRAYCQENGMDFDRELWEPFKPLFEDRKLPAFPLQALPCECREFVLKTANIKQVSPDMVAAGVMGTFAAAMQKKYVVVYGDYHTEPLSLYVVVGADPAERKSSVIHTLRQPFSIYQTLTDNRLFSSGDVTQEKLAELMLENDERMAILAAEGVIFEILGGRYGNTPNFELFKEAYDGSEVTIDRKTSKSLRLNNPAVSAVVYCQLGVIQKFVSNIAFLEQGLCGRFMYVLPEKYAGSGNREYKRSLTSNDVEAYEKSLEWYSGAIMKFLKESFPKKPQAVWISEDAEDYAEEMFEKYERLIAGEWRHRSDWAGKAFGRTIRIAGVMALMQGETVIRRETLTNAFTIGDYLIEHAKAAYGILGNNPIANDALKALELIKKTAASGRYELTRRDVYLFFRGNLSLKNIDEILELLESCNYIKTYEDRPERRGRPSIKMFINRHL